MIKKKSNTLIIVLIVLLIIIAMLLGLGAFGGNPQDKVQKPISLGDRYYEEMDYDRAIAAYTEALEIDPKNVEVKTALGDAYKARGTEYAEKSKEDPAQEEKAVQDLKTARTYYEEVLANESLPENEKADISKKIQETESLMTTIPRATSVEPGSNPPEETGKEATESQAKSAEQNLYQYFNKVSDEEFLSSREAKRQEMVELHDVAYQLDGIDVGYETYEFFMWDYPTQILEQADLYEKYNIERWNPQLPSSKVMLAAFLAVYYANALEDATIRQYPFSELEEQLNASTVSLVQSELYDYTSKFLVDYSQSHGEDRLNPPTLTDLVEADDYYLFEVTPADGSKPVKLLFRDYYSDNLWGNMNTQESFENVTVSIHKEEYPQPENLDRAHIGTEVRYGFVDMIVLEDNSSTSNEQYYAPALQDYADYEQYVADNLGDTHVFADERQLNWLVSEGGDLYYRLLDLNQDGIDELIIAREHDDNLEVVDFYANGAEGPVHVLNYQNYYGLSDRSKVSFDIDNYQIMIFGSYSAFSEYAAVYRLDPGASEAVFVEQYTHDTMDDNMEYYHTDENSNHTPITEEEFSQYYGKMDEMLGNPDIFNPADWKLVREHE